MEHIDGNLICVIDYETTPEEIWQVAFLPADRNLKPIGHHKTMVIRPSDEDKCDRQIMRVSDEEFREIMRAPLNHEQAAKEFETWFRGLREKGLLGWNKRLLPIAQNAHFDRWQTSQWLGPDLVDECFNAWYRDPMNLATMINDMHMLTGTQTEPVPYPRCNLDALCKAHDVDNKRAHDATEDCLATLEVYRRMVLKHAGALL